MSFTLIKIGFNYKSVNDLKKFFCKYSITISDFQLRTVAQDIETEISVMDIYRKWFKFPALNFTLTYNFLNDNAITRQYGSFCI